MTAGPALPAEGAVLRGKYRVVRKLGSVVFEALDLTTDTRVAVKLVRLDPSLDRERKEHLLREALGSIRLRSPFVARVFDLDCTDDAEPVLVTELLSGRDLGAELSKVGKLPVGVAASYVVQACAGVAEAQALGLSHGELEPTNLFLETGPEAATVRVLGFGLAKLRGANSVDARSDVRALGLVLYRALTGEAFGERLPSDLAPEWLAVAIAKALAKKPEDRYPDARAFGRALAPFLSRTDAPTARAVDALESAAPARLGAPRGKATEQQIARPMESDEATTQPTLDPSVRPPLSTKDPTTLPNRPDEIMPSDRRPTILFEGEEGDDQATADQGLAARAAMEIVAEKPRPRPEAPTAADLSKLLASTLGEKPKTSADLSDLLTPPPRPRVEKETAVDLSEDAGPRGVHVSFVLAAVSVIVLIAALITAWLRLR